MNNYVVVKRVYLMPKKVTIYLLVVGILLSLSLILGYTYSIYQIDKKQSTVNEIHVGCFTINFEDSGTDSTTYTDLSITNSYPLTTEEAMAKTPYKFRITNVCNYVSKTDISINVLKTSSISQMAINQGKTIGDMVDVSIQEGTRAASVPINLSSFDEGTIRSEDNETDVSYLIRTDFLDAGESKTFNIWMWVPKSINDVNIGNEAQGLTLYAKVDVLSTAVDDAEQVSGKYSAYIKDGRKSKLKSFEITGGTKDGNNVGQSGTIDLVVSGKNLVNYNKMSMIYMSSYGPQLFNNGDGTFELTGQLWWVEMGADLLNRFRGSDAKNIIFAPGTYTASMKKCDGSPIDPTKSTYFSMNSFYNNDNVSNYKMFRTDDPTKLSTVITEEMLNYDDFWIDLGLIADDNKQPDEGVYCPQLEYGETSTEFEPYKERRYSIELKDTSDNLISGLGENDVLKKVNGTWVIDNGSTQVELATSTQDALNNIQIYEGVSRVWVDDSVLINNISVEYYAK